MTDIRTEKEKKRVATHSAICKEYVELENQHPDVRPFRLIKVVAEKFGMSVPGVANILKKNGMVTQREK